VQKVAVAAAAAGSALDPAAVDKAKAELSYAWTLSQASPPSPPVIATHTHTTHAHHPHTHTLIAAHQVTNFCEITPWSPPTQAVYPTAAVGDAMTVSAKMHKKYSPHFAACGGGGAAA
jgi:hypothetical protein